jgi:6-phosphofructokinase
MTDRLDVDSYRLGMGAAIHTIAAVIDRLNTDPQAAAELTALEVLGRLVAALREASATITDQEAR